MATFETIGLRATLDGLTPYLLGAQRFNIATDSMGRSTERAAGLSSKLATGLKLATAAVAAATAVIGVAATRSAIGYEKTLAQIDALTNATSEDTARLGKELLNLSKRVAKSPQELGAAAYFALSSGINDVADALAVVEQAAKASAAGLGETRQIVDVVTSVLNAYGKENITAARATDILVATVREGKGEAADFANVIGGVIPIAAALKVPFEEVGTLLAVITNGGDNAAEATTKLRGILNQLASPSDAAKKALRETGRFTGIFTTEVVKATASSADLTAAQLDVADAQDKYNKTLEENGPLARETERAQNNLTLAQQKLTEIQGKSRDRVVQTHDAYAQLRKEIDERGLLPVLFKLRNAFEGNLEGLAEIFPDVRGFIGFLSAIESQGNQTTQVMRRIQASAGITDEAFQRMTKTVSFQIDLLKTQLNVALVNLGSKILPLVTAGVEGLITAFARLQSLGASVVASIAPVAERLAHFFALGTGGGQIGGNLAGIDQTFFRIGQAASEAQRGISDFVATVSNLAHLFSVGFAGGDIGGQFTGLQQAAFLLGQIMRNDILPAVTALSGALAAITFQVPVVVGSFFGWLNSSGLLRDALLGLQTVAQGVLLAAQGLALIIQPVAEFFRENETAAHAAAIALGILALALTAPVVSIGVLLVAIGKARKAFEDVHDDLKALAEANKRTFLAIVATAGEAFGALQSIIKAALNFSLADAGRLLISTLIEGITSTFDVLRRAAGEVVRQFKDGFTGFASLLEGIGKSLVEGVWRGIEGAKDWFFRNIKGFFKDALDSALAAIGAGSPARTWIPVGEAIMEGVGVGIDRKKAEIEKKLRELQPSNTDGGSGGGGGRSTPSTFNIPSPGVGGIPIDRSLPPRPQPTGYTVPPGYYWDGYTFVRIPGLPPTAYYQQGTSYVPRDMWAFIHAGEAVLNRRQANDWRMVPQRSQEVLARMGPQYNQSFGGPTFSPMFNVSGATLEQQESAAISAVRRFFGDLRYRSLNAGSFLSPAVG